MRTTMLSITVAVALLPFFVGCSGQRGGQVARAQGPAGGYPTANAGQSGDDCYEQSRRCNRCNGRGCRFCRPYHVPTDLVYPQAGPAMATVQYPYYTNKGPDCFFLQP